MITLIVLNTRGASIQCCPRYLRTLVWLEVLSGSGGCSTWPAAFERVLTHPMAKTGGGDRVVLGKQPAIGMASGQEMTE